MRPVFGVFLVVCALAVGLAVRTAVAEEVKCGGMIASIAGELITVKGEARNFEMKIEPATKIMLNGKPVSPMELKVGQRVTCICETTPEGMICTTMLIEREMVK